MTTKLRISMPTFEYANLKYQSWYFYFLELMDSLISNLQEIDAIMPPDLPNSSNTVSPEAQNYPLTHSYLVSSKEQTRLGTVEHLVLLRPKETLLTFKVKQVQNHSQVMLLAVKTWCHFFCWIQLMTRKTEWVQSCEAIKEVQIAASHVLLKHLQVKNPLLLPKMSFSTEWLPFSSYLIVVLGHRLKVWLGYLFTARK